MANEIDEWLNVSGLRSERWRLAGWPGGVSPPVWQESIQLRKPLQRRDAAGPAGEDASVPAREVTIVNTGEKKQLSLHVEVPVEEMAKLNEYSRDEVPSGPAGQSVRASIWPAIHPRLLELIGAGQRKRRQVRPLRRQCHVVHRRRRAPLSDTRSAVVCSAIVPAVVGA